MGAKQLFDADEKGLQNRCFEPGNRRLYRYKTGMTIAVKPVLSLSSGLGAKSDARYTCRQRRTPSTKSRFVWSIIPLLT